MFQGIAGKKTSLELEEVYPNTYVEIKEYHIIMHQAN